MKRQFLLVLSFSFFLLAEAQPYTGIKPFDKKKAEELIVGQWQQTKLSITSDQIKGFNEAMNNPMVRASFKNMATATSCQFDSSGRFIAMVASTSDTMQYQLSAGGSFTIYSHKKKKLPQKNKILELSSDTFIYTTTRKANAPEMVDLFTALGLKKDPAHTVTYTYTYTKVKEANAPWQLIKSNLPENRWVENLVFDGSNLFTLVSDPSSQNDDSVYASNNDGTSWSYAGLAIPKSEQGIKKMMNRVGSTVFVETEKGVFATENKGKSWSEISGLPTDLTGMGLPQFGTTASRIYSGFGAKVFASGDNAASWKPAKTPLQVGDNIMALAAGGNKIVIGGISANMNAGGQSNGIGAFLLLSADEGQSWKDIQLTSEDYPGIMATYLAIVGTSLFMDTQYGLFRLDLQQIKWTPVKGLSMTPATNLYTPDEPTGSSGETILASGTTIFYGGEAGMFLSDNGGDSWTEMNNKELRKGVNSFVINNAHVIALTAESKLFQASVKELLEYIKTNGK